ncbi:MAG: arginine N-succinyltransferase [Pseudomonadota bacterium]|nr:arginine N-succinyltransferase [Pseudomonadota bacterium]
MHESDGKASGTALESVPDSRRFGWLQVVVFVSVAVIISVGITLWVLRSGVFQSEFRPVALNAIEQQTLAEKLDRLQDATERRKAGVLPADTGAPLKPEPYAEAGALRQVTFSERELNAMLARNTDLSRRVAIDLSDDLISARILLPMEEDFPVLGGKTLRVRAGAEFAYSDDRAVVKLRGVSVMGVPLPNAWLGGLKHIDLVREFGTDPGFWKSFSDGIEDVRVGEGSLMVRLKE